MHQEIAVQTELFDTEIDITHREIKATFDRVENVRKGIFKRHNELAKLYMDLSQEIQNLKREIAQLKKEKYVEDESETIFNFAAIANF